MEKKVLWFFVVALLAVDIFMLIQRGQMGDQLVALQRASAVAKLKASYAEEEERVINELRRVPEGFPLLRGRESGDEGAVELVLVASVEDCTNCIEDEIDVLNSLARSLPHDRLTGIRAFIVDDDRPEQAMGMMARLNPEPEFPMELKDVLPYLPNASTPLVLVLRTRDGRVLDAYKPIPEDYTKRDSFYARWTSVLGLS